LSLQNCTTLHIFYKHKKEEWFQKSTFINTKQTHATTTTTTVQLFPWLNSILKIWNVKEIKHMILTTPSILSLFWIKLNSKWKVKENTHTHTHTNLFFGGVWSHCCKLLKNICWKFNDFFFKSQKNKNFGHISINGSRW
jgi:hypothetical protein